MDTPTLVSLPLPMATALLCVMLAGLMCRLDLGPTRANVFFAGFFGLGAVSSLLVALRFGYGMEHLIPIQRTLPLFLGPLLYLGFASLAVGGHGAFQRALLHLGGPIAFVGLAAFLSDDLRFLDLVISASYAVYGIALFRLWRRGPDTLIHAPVHVTGTMSNWMLRGIGLLAFLFVLDSAIAIDFAMNKGANAPRLISFGTIPLVLVLLATLMTLPKMLSRRFVVPEPVQAPDTEDADLMTRLDRVMTEHHLFLEPDITVQRLARRLSVPARNLSGAVNRTQGLNVSQYVNRYRLAHAAHLLSETDDSVTSIATQSGFTARSNFYRAFQGVYGQTPVAYRVSAKQPSGAQA